MLCVGVAITQIPPQMFESGDTDVENDARSSFDHAGVMLSFLHALVSALAGVYNEKLLKADKGSMHAANVQLYTYGMLVNIVGVCMRTSDTSLTYGMERPLTWVVGFNMHVHTSLLGCLLFSTSHFFRGSFCLSFQRGFSVLPIPIINMTDQFAPSDDATIAPKGEPWAVHCSPHEVP